jgi:hypothetical protein
LLLENTEQIIGHQMLALALHRQRLAKELQCALRIAQFVVHHGQIVGQFGMQSGKLPDLLEQT